MIEENQIPQIKEQLISQINSTFPEDKKASAIEQIQTMNKNQLTEFLAQNNLIKNDSSKETTPASAPTPSDQCAFCSIHAGKIPSTKIAESEGAIAILEINPLSEGHTIILQKDHQNTIPPKIEEFAKTIQEKLRHALSPKDVLIEHGEMFGHAIINVIPIYGDSLETDRKQATPEQLAQVQQKISSAPEVIIQDSQKTEEIKENPKQEEEINSKNTWLPKRIP